MHKLTLKLGSFKTQALVKNMIAYDALLGHHGYTMVYRPLFGSPDHKVKFYIGSIKEGFFPSVTGTRRSMFDVAMHIFFDIARIWMFVSNDPSAMCAWVFFLTQAWMYFCDFTEYIGVYGM